MKVTLLRHCELLVGLVLVGLLMGGTRPAQAAHLLGGEMTYRYLDATGPTTAPLRYELTLTVYNSCGATAIRSSAVIGIYSQGTGAKVALTATNYAAISNGNMNVPQTSLDACTTPSVPPGCTIVGASQAYQLQKFIGIVNLPATAQGYYALWTDGNRNAGITNIANPSDDQYMTLYSTLAPPSRPNSSPVFVDKAVANLCINDTTYLLNNATDADGDRLEYSLAQPYGNFSTVPPGSFVPAPSLVPYAAAQYTATTPLGTTPGNYAGINASTGIAKYRTTAALNSKFVVAIDVKEYRFIAGIEQLIGITRRDLQLVVVSCPNTVPPVLPTAAAGGGTPRAFTIEAGSTLSIPLTVNHVNDNPLTLSLSSVLLDGPGGYNATFDGSPGTVLPGNPAGTASTTSTVVPFTGTFVYTAGCNEARAAPYDLTITVKDNGCAGKTVSDVIRITVVKPTGPTAIAGNLAVCGLNTVQSYTASGGTAPTVSWTVTGGTIVGSSTANPVQVSWPAAGTGTVTAQGVTQYGCPTGQVTSTVTISPAPALTVTGSQTICQGGSTTLTVTGGTAPYTLAGGPAPLSGAGPFVLSPTQTTTYTIVGTAAGGACAATGQVTIMVNPVPVANAGAAVALCAGSTGQLGAAPVAGYTYSWSPATGLSSSTVANPSVSLPTPIRQTYTLTVTSAATGCGASSTVVVTVSPLPVATPGAAITMCPGATGQLGAAAAADLQYSWSPTTGLSDPTVANPTVTLTNTTGAPITQTYTLTVTNPRTTCANTATVAVTVNPALDGGTIGANQTVCAGAVPAPLTSLTAASGAGPGPYVYQWESSPDNATWKAIANSASLGYAPGAVAVTTYFRRRALAGTCGPAYTNVVTVQAQPLVVPGVQLPALPAQCAGSAFTFTPVPTNAGATPTYRWFVNTVLVSSGPTFTSATLADGDLVQVELTPTVGFCATGTAVATARVSLTPVPLPRLVVVAQTALPVCVGAPVRFVLDQATNIGTSPQYQWQVDGVSVSGATGTTFTTATLRDGQVVTLVVRTTNACGQPATATSGVVRVAVNPPVHVSAGPAKTITEGESVTLEGTADGSYPVTWTPSQTLTFASGNPLRPVATPLATTTYTLSAGAGPCAGQSSVTVTVLRRVRIPNAFTPNADNSDDTWQIANIEDYPGNHVQVFNRWGRQVFEATNYNRSSEWNGTANGSPLPFGTYYYIVTLGNGKSYAGPITVVR